MSKYNIETINIYLNRELAGIHKFKSSQETELKSESELISDARRYQLYDILKAESLNVLRVKDEVVTTDIDGTAIFQVAHIEKRDDQSIYIFIRKYALSKERPMDTSGKDGISFEKTDLYKWLNGEYRKSLPFYAGGSNECKIFLPSEHNIFGEDIYGEGGDIQWNIFKETKERIRTRKSEYGSPVYWWESSPYVSGASAFCLVITSGAADASGASGSNGVVPCFQMKTVNK